MAEQPPHNLSMSRHADPVYAAADGTRLAQLQAIYLEAKASKDAAEQKLKAVTDAIKSELSTLHPGAPKVTLAASGDAPALQLTYVESWRIDTNRLKTEAPETYVRYAAKSGYWKLEQARGGKS